MTAQTTAVNGERLKKAWKSFVEHRYEEDRDRIRPVILSSWKRCSSLKVNPWQTSVPNKLEESELADLKGEHKEFLNSSMPILYELYVSIKDAPFVITIANPSGVILKTIGNSEALEMVRPGNYVEGADWSEASAGTNGIGTSIATGAPVQVYSYEHYCRCSQHFTCSTSPVRDSMGRLMGVITITGRDVDANDFTMGMIIAAAEIIESRIQLQRVRREQRNEQLYRNALINLTQRAALSVDNEGRICDINSEAVRLLDLERSINYTGKSLKELLSIENLPVYSRIREEEILTEELVVIGKGRRRRHYRMTARPFYDAAGNKAASFVVFDEDGAAHGNSGHKAKRQTKPHTYFHDLVGVSEAHRRTVAMAEQAAHSDSTILILGESGTGKGMLAEAIHNASRRRKSPFISVNCGAIPKSLIASELFGYVDGAFTGARRGGQIGKFEAAHGGTIFLDEIGDMPMSMQVNLLQVLETRSIVRVGSTEEIPIDVRIIAATNKNLHEEIRKGRFREDLYYRLNVISIRQPALRERPEDIAPLIYSFYEEYCARDDLSCRGSISPEYVRVLSSYPFPGNIRELRNLVERSVFLSPEGALTTEYLPEDLLKEISRNADRSHDHLKENGRSGSLAAQSGRASEKTVPARDTGIPQDQGQSAEAGAEEAQLRELLRRYRGNISKAAGELGVARSTLYRRMRKFGIA